MVHERDTGKMTARTLSQQTRRGVNVDVRRVGGGAGESGTGAKERFGLLLVDHHETDRGHVEHLLQNGEHERTHAIEIQVRVDDLRDLRDRLEFRQPVLKSRGDLDLVGLCRLHAGLLLALTLKYHREAHGKDQEAQTVEGEHDERNPILGYLRRDMTTEVPDHTQPANGERDVTPRPDRMNECETQENCEDGIVES